MRVVLVSTYVYPVALGMRYVSSYLKRAGHRVTLLFMCSKHDYQESGMPDSLQGDFIDLCRPANVIGLSLMTNSFYRSAAMTTAIRHAGIQAPILWGGTHPTVAPEECAEIADYVCIGEGEKAMLEFVEAMEAGRDPATVRNFAFQRNGALVRNPTIPLTDDLDDYPFPDYSLDDHWVASNRHLVPARPDLLRGAVRRYRASSTRGCPYSCSFCNNATQMALYRGPGLGKWVRKRSTESVISEIEQVRARYPGMEAVNLIDDLFLIRQEDELEAFVEAYRERVNLPLEIDVFPNTITDRKVELLALLPIDLISMGIQSGCEDTLRNLYNRPTAAATVARAVEIIARHKLRAEYHYLVANPLESDESRLQTLRFAADHHRGPAKLRLFPLQFYPGSVIYDQACRAGIIGKHHEVGYQYVYAGHKHMMRIHYLEVWLMIILSLRGAGLSPRMANRLVDLVTNRRVRWLLDRQWFPPVAFVTYRAGRVAYRNLVLKPFIRPWHKLRGGKGKGHHRVHETPREKARPAA